MHNKQIEEILAEYMEKFGKDLNEAERRTGDELFMWLKDKLTPHNPRKLDIQAAEKRLLKIIEAGEEARGETWETRFEQKYPLGGEVWVLERHRDELKSFVNIEREQAYQSGVEAERERIDSKIGFLRQWLNERSKTYLVSNKDIRHWLDISTLTNQGETK